MSAFDINKIPCPEIQRNLEDYYTTVNPNQFLDIPFAFYLTSPVNTAPVQSVQAIVSPGNQKLRTIQMIWTPRILESEISETVDFSCTTEQESGMLETTCTIDTTDGVKSSEKFDIINLSTICEDNPAFINQRLAAHLDGLVRKMETKLHTQAVALIGDFPANDTQSLITSEVKDIEVLTSAGAPAFPSWSLARPRPFQQR